MAKRRSLIAVLVLLLVLASAPAAHAQVTAKASVVTDGVGVSKIVVKLSSMSAVTAQNRPTKVIVVGGGETYPLTRVTSVAMTGTKLGTWKSAGFYGDGQDEVLALVGKQATVKVTSRLGTTSSRPNVTSPDTMGRAAINEMTGYINGAAFRDYSPSGSERYDLHLCTDGWTRYYHDFNSEVGSVTTEKFGQPWSVTKALVNSSGTYARALVHVTFTERNDFDSGGSEINEPWDTLIEYSQETWYWAHDVAETLLASCDPTF